MLSQELGIISMRGEKFGGTLTSNFNLLVGIISMRGENFGGL